MSNWKFRAEPVRSMSDADILAYRVSELEEDKAELLSALEKLVSPISASPGYTFMDATLPVGVVIAAQTLVIQHSTSFSDPGDDKGVKE